MNVLVIAPHPDDESIGCGGSLCLHSSRGDRVTAVFLTSGELGLKQLPREDAWQIREREAEAAAGILGLAHLEFLRQPDWYVSDAVDEAAAGLAPILAREEPRTVYLPHARESHPDHRAALPVLRAALRLCQVPVPTLLTYEVWTPLAEHYHVEDITPVVRRKIQAVRAHRSQIQQLPYDSAVRGLNLYRGAIAGGCRYAEIFSHAEPIEAKLVSEVSGDG